MPNIEFFRACAADCQEMARQVRSEETREQLLLWAVEFEEQAARFDLAIAQSGPGFC